MGQQAIDIIEKEKNDINNMLTRITVEEGRLKQQRKEIVDRQTKLKETHSSLLMSMTKIKAQIREGDENKRSSEDLISQRDVCQNEINNLEQMKRPLLNEKDNLSRILLKMEDSLKKERGEVNRIYSEIYDTSDLQRQIETRERKQSTVRKEIEKCQQNYHHLLRDEEKFKLQFSNAETDALKFCNNRRVNVTKNI